MPEKGQTSSKCQFCVILFAFRLRLFEAQQNPEMIVRRIKSIKPITDDGCRRLDGWSLSCGVRICGATLLLEILLMLSLRDCEAEQSPEIMVN